MILQKIRTRHYQSFTLIELLVVIAIIRYGRVWECMRVYGKRAKPAAAG